MPLSKTTGKTRGGGQGGTHAHYAGEFGTSPRHKLGAQEQTSALAKNPEYRAARAEHFAHVARRANEEHAKAHSEGRHADASSHALASAHASQMASKHAKAAKQMGVESHAYAAQRAAGEAHTHHNDILHRSGDPKRTGVPGNPHFDAKASVAASHEHHDAIARITSATHSPKSAVSVSELEHMKSDFAAKITPAEKSSLLQYSTTTWDKINSGLRSGNLEATLKRHVENLDAAIGKSVLSRDTVVYRGIGGAISKQFASMTVGSFFTEKGFSSSSASKSAIFDKSTRLHITVPAGGRGATIPSKLPHEDEILLPRNQKFRVDRIEHSEHTDAFNKTRNITTLHVSAIHDDAMARVTSTTHSPKSVEADHASNALKTTAFKSSQDASATSVTAHSAGTMASHHDAADAHERAAKAHAEAGDHAEAARHEAHRQNHLRAALDVNHAETVKVMHERESHPDVLRARHLTAKAEAASARAEKSGDKADHDAAALAHGNAVAASRTIGEKGMIRGHVRAADEHAEKGSGRAAHDKSAEASTKARDLSYMIDEGHSKDHGGAEKLHRAAAQSAAAVGAHDVAREHTQKADEHAKHGAGTSKPATTLSTRANQVSAIAKVAPSAAAHADAAGAHHNAAAAMNRAGLQGQAAQHAAKAAEHQKAAEGVIAGHGHGTSFSQQRSDEAHSASKTAQSSQTAASHQEAANAHAQAAIAHRASGDPNKASEHISHEQYHRSETRIAIKRERGGDYAPLSAGTKGSRIRK